MKSTRWFVGIGLLLCSTANARGEFIDNFSGGLSPTYWTVSQTLGGLYSVVTPPNVQLSRTDSSISGLNNVTVTLNLAAAINMSSIAGDFSMSIDFSNASLPLPGTGVDQIELHAGFSDGSILFDSFSNEYPQGSRNSLEYHVWNADGSLHGLSATSNTGGTFTIERVGSIVSGYYDGSLIYSGTNTAGLNNVAFTLQNFNGSDPIGVTFSNFSLSTAVPEPASVAMLTIGLLGIGLKARRSLRQPKG